MFYSYHTHIISKILYSVIIYADQLSRLHMILKPFMLRRIKKDVEHEMAEKVKMSQTLLISNYFVRSRSICHVGYRHGNVSYITG